MDLGHLCYFLGIKISQSPQGILLSQRKYVLDMLRECGVLGCKLLESPVFTTRKFLPKDGSPMKDPEPLHVFRYLKATPGLGVLYSYQGYCRVGAFTRKRWQNIWFFRCKVGWVSYFRKIYYWILCLCRWKSSFLESKKQHIVLVPMRIRILISEEGSDTEDDQRMSYEFEQPAITEFRLQITSMLVLSSANSLTSLMEVFTSVVRISRLQNKLVLGELDQHIVSRSSTESEYKAMVDVSFKRQLKEFGINTNDLMGLYCDSQSTIHIVKNKVLRKRTKHIERSCGWHIIKPSINPTDACKNLTSTCIHLYEATS
ncbi:hypothetical protein OSB04_029378 [Centaurea solstitialis]|uniref:Reverse transcriptase Ty1/copia-type domain-containing protein n=1 Tax=Centaurea solstitialis TaxID=347529 RepID=A0AA38VYR1_9ASTR|nr:hypothetical protein OSB04_029378 [Centaurea solstitialis]